MERKKRIANLLTAAAILVMVLLALLLVGLNRGWFAAGEEETVSASDWQGTVNLLRDGVAYPIEAETSLRDGDVLTVSADGSVTLSFSGSSLVLGENTSLSVLSADAAAPSLSVSDGELFAAVGEDDVLTLTFAEDETELSNAVLWLTVQDGTGTACVLSGELTLSDGEVLTASGLTTGELDEFCIRQAIVAGEAFTLCFTEEELRQELEARQQALQDALAEEVNPQDETEETEAPDTEQEETQEPEAESETQPEASDAETTQTEQPEETETKTEPESEPESESEAESESETTYTCTISIRCDSILNNMDALDTAKAAYVPASGAILSTTTVSFTQGETVFDVLKRVCAAAGIALEYSYTPGYNSYYVEGINHIYEFDCGAESGWMYQVNGSFPSTGCSSYVVSQGDSIVFCYTCTGLGADVGA